MLSVLITPYIEDIVKISLEVYPESALIQEHNEIFKAIEEKDISKVYNAIAAHVLLAETPPFYEGTDFDYFEALSKFRRWSL